MLVIAVSPKKIKYMRGFFRFRYGTFRFRYGTLAGLYLLPT